MGSCIINSFAVVILAAGQSFRMGRPKQLLPYQGTPLLEHAISQARAIKPKNVLIVLGANAETLQEQLEFGAVTVVTNSAWEEGISSSIVKGIEAVQGLTETDGVLLMTCDQPYADRHILQKLIDTQASTSSAICASSYGGSFGIPAIFHRSLFPELLGLRGDAGAKKVIRAHQQRTSFLPFEQGSIDIDTASDYEKLIN